MDLFWFMIGWGDQFMVTGEDGDVAASLLAVGGHGTTCAHLGGSGCRYGTESRAGLQPSRPIPKAYVH